MNKFISLLTLTLMEKVELKDLDTYVVAMQIAKEKYQKMHMVHQPLQILPSKMPVQPLPPPMDPRLNQPLPISNSPV